MIGKPFSPGINTLVEDHSNWLQNRKIGLVSHPAALDTRNMTSADVLKENCNLSALFGPEHGYYGKGLAGQYVKSGFHRKWNIPVHSLYGESRRPTADMMRSIDVIVFDLQDLSARPYTYLATLKYMMEACAKYNKTFILADRPVPLPNAVDGPQLKSGYRSFVAPISLPMMYGMTPGETSRWLKSTLKLDLKLKVAKMNNYHRQSQREMSWPDWVPPSPEIKTWDAGYSYTSTVFSEALPVFDNGRGTKHAFTVVGAVDLDNNQLSEELTAMNLPGVTFPVCNYKSKSEHNKGKQINSVKVAVNDSSIFLPVRTSIAILNTLRDMLTDVDIWNTAGARPEFFDKLYGTNSVRIAIARGDSVGHIAGRWQKGLKSFKKERAKHLLYH